MAEEQIVEKIKNELEKIKPYLMSEGGGIEFDSYKDGIVYVRFTGACVNCGLIDYTLKDGVEQLLMNEIPEVKEVRKID